MRVIDVNDKTITEYDLSKGCLVPAVVIREDASSDGKLVWDADDFEDVLRYIPFAEKSDAEKIEELKKQLSDTDYKIIKCSEYQLLGLEMPYDVEALHAERQAIRDQINALENA